MTERAAVQPLRCLVLSDGRRGIENQALGLAERLARLVDLHIDTHVIAHSKAIAALPPRAQLRLASFELPDCDIAIGCGRQAIAALLYVKRARPEVFTVYVQDPRQIPSGFDLVVAPEHDGVLGENVIEMIGSPNRVTDTKIIGETLNFADGLSKLPAPRAAILIGGTSKTHKLDQAAHIAHMLAAQNLMDAGQSLLITTSRRTPEFAVLAWKQFASDHDNIWLHDGEGPNPYFAFLGGADLIFVTEDSTNMLTEACATGKPVYRLPMTPKSASGKVGKFQTLYDALDARCGVVLYAEQISGADYEPLDETARVANLLLEQFNNR
jgi:mitochondrial fission protein ELM1